MTSEAELVGVTVTLQTASEILQREMLGSPAILQEKVDVAIVNKVVKLCTAIFDAASVSRSSDIIDTLTDELKAQSQIDIARRKEAFAAHKFALLQQSLEDLKSRDQKALNKTKPEKGLSDERVSAKDDLAEVEGAGGIHGVMVFQSCEGGHQRRKFNHKSDQVRHKRGRRTDTLVHVNRCR